MKVDAAPPIQTGVDPETTAPPRPRAALSARLLRPLTWLADHPRTLSLGLYALAILLVRPWGNFPLNDDWQYAAFAKHFAETGHLWINLSVAPALVGQELLGYAVIKLFGFSHLGLRLMTMLLAALVLVAIDGVLRAGETRPRARALGLSVLALSPFFFYLATTFMSEIYGLLPALLGAWLWLRDRQRRPLSWTAALGAALLCGVAFWSRQFAGLVLPALALTTGLLLLADKPALKRALPKLAAALLLFAACAIAHGEWAHATHNDPQVQHLTLEQLMVFDPFVWESQPGIALVYLTGFSLPLLLLFPWKPRGQNRWLPAALLLGAAFAAQHLTHEYGFDDFGVSSLRHTAFPYAGCVLVNAGIGPLTITDAYWGNHPSPLHWPMWVWRTIEAVLIAATVCWSPAGSAFRSALRERPRAAEVALFGAMFALLSFLAAVLVQQPWIHDRYYFPSAVGLCISLAALVRFESIQRIRWIGAGVAALLLAGFTVGGVHDEFRWNEARWTLIDRMLKAGVAPHAIDGGFEVNGWFSQFPPDNHPSSSCVGTCHCDSVWNCNDDTNRIGFSIGKNYALSDTETAHTWLGADLTLLWTRRQYRTQK